MDIGLYHSGIHTQLAAGGDFILMRYLNHTFMHLLDDFRPELTTETSYGLVVWNLLSADARELAIHQIGAHFPRQFFKAPSAHVFQQHHSEHHLSRRGWPPARLALL